MAKKDSYQARSEAFYNGVHEALLRAGKAAERLARETGTPLVVRADNEKGFVSYVPKKGTNDANCR